MAKRCINTYIHKVYIAEGFINDCEYLIHRCSRVNKLTYPKFCEIWQDMNMSCMYHGRTMGAEIAELSEEVLQVAKQFMFKKSVNFDETVAAVFLVYALLNLQPYRDFAALRITPEDVPTIKQIEQTAREEKRHDLLYILGSILVKGCHYTATPREMGMEPAIRKYLLGDRTIDKLSIRSKGVFGPQNEEVGLLRDLAVLTNHYKKAKEGLSGDMGKDRNLSYVNTDIPEQLNNSLRRLLIGFVDDDHDEPNEINTAKAIKERAMKNAVNPMQHLKSIEERKRKTTAGSKNEKYLKKGKHVKRRIPDTSSDEEDDLDTSYSTDNIEKTEEMHSECESEVDPSKNILENVRIIDASDVPSENCIEFQSLPNIFRTESDNKIYEIEIIDEYAGDRKKKIELSEETEFSIEKVFIPEEESSKATPGDKAEDFAVLIPNSNVQLKTTYDVSQATHDISITTDNVAKITDDVSKATHDISITTDNVAKATDDVSIATDDVSKTTDDVSKATDDASIATDDVSKTTDEVSKATDDESNATDDVTKTTDDVTKTTDDVSKTTDDVSHTIDDASKTTEDVSKATDISRTTDAVSKTKDKKYQPHRIKKPERRDMKKTVLKSKFKRLGMLPVANFEEKNEVNTRNRRKQK